jgi:hypothetical protein
MMIQDSITQFFLLNIPIGRQKNFAENFWQFGNALSKRFTRLGVDGSEYVTEGCLIRDWVILFVQ